MPEKKEKLNLSEIKKELDFIKKSKDKIQILKSYLKNPEYKDLKVDLTKIIVPLLTSQDNTKVEYRLTYDSLNEGLEQIYFWILDFMRDSSPGGLDLEVKKGQEIFEASVSSGYFGEIGQRATLMQQKAMEYLSTINNVLKSIINIIYDLKEFEIRLKAYNESKSEKQEEKDAAIKSLKGIWMDQVDARKGRASINLLTQDLQFITLRDAFFYVNTPKDINDLDLNERVKNILKRKLEEYSAWCEMSEKEIRKRYSLEKVYLRSQAGTLRLYANWLKPYLIAAQKLKMRSSEAKTLTNPNIVNSFSNMEMEIKLYGTKEVEPRTVHESLREIILDTKYYAVIEVIANFRSVPSALSGQGGRHYIHGGRTDLTFKAFVYDDTEKEALENFELYEDLDLIEDFVGMSLELLQKEIDEYLKEKPKEEEPKKLKSQNPFAGTISSFRDMFKPIKVLKFHKMKVSPIIYSEVEKAAENSAKKFAFTIYNVYKKTHGMIAP